MPRPKGDQVVKTPFLRLTKSPFDTGPHSERINLESVSRELPFGTQGVHRLLFSERLHVRGQHEAAIHKHARREARRATYRKVWACDNRRFQPAR